MTVDDGRGDAEADGERHAVSTPFIEVAEAAGVITGAGSGIGRATACELLVLTVPEVVDELVERAP